jgi:hypothetical protein
LELPPIFTTGIIVNVSPNGRKLTIRRLKDQDAPVPGNIIRVSQLALLSPWKGEPHDVLLRYDDNLGVYVGILSSSPRIGQIAPPQVAPSTGTTPSGQSPLP